MPVGVYKIVGSVDPLSRNQKGVSDTFVTGAQVYLKKPNDTPPPYYVANEYICAELARLIRLPVPPAFVARYGGDLCFCSLDYNLSADRLPPIDPEVAIREEPNLCAGVIAFDIWVANTDRHRRNISFQATRDPHRLNAIDHGHALFAASDSLTWAADRFAVEGAQRGGRGNRQCLLDWLADDQRLSDWVGRIERLDSGTIREIFQDAIAAELPEDLAKQGASFLLDRRQKLRQLVSSNRAEFPKITAWGLQWPAP